jgi:hypothetical protein
MSEKKVPVISQEKLNHLMQEWARQANGGKK